METLKTQLVEITPMTGFVPHSVYLLDIHYFEHLPNLTTKINYFADLKKNRHF